MTIPLIVLAVCAVLLSAIGTPAWPWFHDYLSGHLGHAGVVTKVSVDVLLVMLASSVIVAAGIGLGWWLYGRKPVAQADAPDALEKLQPDLFALLREKFFVDELYEATVVRFNAWCARASRWLDDVVWNGCVLAASYLVLSLSWLNRLTDEFVVNLGFDKGCGSVRLSARLLSLWQNGQVQRYLRVLALALTVGALMFIWGCHA
jgi:NADH-quinone oxidoreductase subunit L